MKKILTSLVIGLVVMVLGMVVALLMLVNAFPVYVSPIIIDGNNPGSYIWLNRVDNISITKSNSYNMEMLEEPSTSAILELRSNSAFVEPLLLDTVDTSVLGEDAEPKLVIAVITGNEASQKNAVVYYDAEDYSYDNIGYFIPYSNSGNFVQAKRTALVIGTFLGIASIIVSIIVMKKREQNN